MADLSPPVYSLQRLVAGWPAASRNKACPIVQRHTVFRLFEEHRHKFSRETRLSALLQQNENDLPR
jgi:hypothetical protein